MMYVGRVASVGEPDRRTPVGRPLRCLDPYVSRRPPNSPVTPDPRTVAERQIREAEAAGAFANLEGAGRPLDLGDLHDPHWWIKAKLERERLSVLPPLLAVRLEREKFLENVGRLTSAAIVRRETSRLNERIERARLAPSLGSLPLTVKPLDVEDVLDRWAAERERF